MAASASVLAGKLTAGVCAIVFACLFEVKKAEELEAEELRLEEK